MTRYALADPGFWWATIVGGLPIAVVSMLAGRYAARFAVKVMPWT